MSFSLVPNPVLSITSLPNPLYAGTNFVMVCTIELSEGVDTDITVASGWQRDGEELTSNDHITVSDTTMTGNFEYQIQVFFDVLWWNTDNGEYRCEADVSPVGAAPFVIPSGPSTEVVTIIAASTLKLGS